MTRQEELVQAARKEYPEWEEAQCHYIDGAHYADSHPHWFSVEDCLPKIEEANCEWVGSEDVLALLWNGDMSVGRYERDNSTGEHYWVLYGVDKDLVVTHWMPLPQAPKEGGER